MIPKATKQFLDFTIKSSESGFAGLLNSCAKPRLLDVSKENGVSFIYRLVPYVCKDTLGTESKTSFKYQLPVSTAMAVFDELSTMAFIIEDTNKRPGVSIHLETQVFRQSKEINISPVADSDQNKGIDVLVATKVRKIGKSVGFCDITMHSADGHTLLAKGSHVKFLPMGIVWDWLFSPTLLPFFMYILNSIPLYLKAMIAPNFKHQGLPKMEKKSIFEELNISKEGTFKVNPMLCNPVGALHGGALAVACEEIITRKIASSKQVIDLEIKYLRTMKGDITIEMKDEDPIEENRRYGFVINKKGQLCAQFSARLSG